MARSGLADGCVQMDVRAVRPSRTRLISSQPGRNTSTAPVGRVRVGRVGLRVGSTVTQRGSVRAGLVRVMERLRVIIRVARVGVFSPCLLLPAMCRTVA